MPLRSFPPVDDTSARGIAAAVGRAISAGQLTTGTRLPTVRTLAKHLSVSPTTVSEAWQMLARVGAIEGRGRLGTFVREPVGPGAPRRYRRVTSGGAGTHLRHDLSTGTPDTSLLPDPGPLLARLGNLSMTSSYVDVAVLPALEARLRDDWPFPPRALTVVDGAMDALDRVAQAVVRIGDRVVVENPTFAPLLDLLDQLGADVVGVELDEHGPSIESLREAMTHRPTAIFLQPRAHNPTGISMTAARAEAIAGVVAGSSAIVVEDDHSGDIASSPAVSIGRWLPEHTVHIRSYSKSHGPDLRLAAVGGATGTVTGLANRRLLGPGWSSRILQTVLLAMLDDDDTRAAIRRARDEYARRRRAVTAVLDAANVGYTGTDGINLWLEVADERAALVSLAAQGIGVAPGEPFMVTSTTPHIRATIGLLAADHIAVGGQLAAAARLGLASGSTR